MPNVWLSPLPPDNSGLTYSSAPFQSRAPRKSVEVIVVSCSESGLRLFLPEYDAAKLGCVCVTVVS
jgi:hypothetical protein